MNLRDEDELRFTWKVVDTRREPHDRHYILWVPDPEGYIESDRYVVTAVAFERK